MKHRIADGSHPQSGPSSAARAWRVARWAAALLLATMGSAAQAGPDGTNRPASEDNLSEVRRHGAVARWLWMPEAASVRFRGQYLSAGLAFGVRGPIRSAVGAVAPALVLDIDHRSNLTLMASGSRGAMLVWQHRL